MPKFETSLAPHVKRRTLASTLLPENEPTTLSLAYRMFVVQVAYAPRTSVALTYLTSSCLTEPKLISVPAENTSALAIALLRIPR